MEAALAYRNLPDITGVQARTDADAPLFRELAEVLTKHGAIDRFGIVLLHKHFEVKSDEVMLESTDRDGREQLTRPVKRTEIGNINLVETSWRLGADGSTIMGCFCPRDPYDGAHLGTHQHTN